MIEASLEKTILISVLSSDIASVELVRRIYGFTEFYELERVFRCVNWYLNAKLVVWHDERKFKCNLCIWNLG